ncbi:GNAT family N-acetyltransferase [Acetobacteraceae bacterium KSS8]|uniref:GNAT family N-acetyltransferase n=1 Tax=Endosaccharibacter trunci TaxID=2812733 RepID=A0ABT1W8Q8_9PROT|nr:GNAT family N-acetyltransferase [Acetobacteraceae bacterium KSS8]
MLPDRLETDRISLRPAVVADAGALFAAYASDPEVARYTTWRPHASVSDTEHFLQSCSGRTAACTFALVERGSNRPIGVFDLRRPQPSRVEYGCALGRAYWGQGLMTEAVCAAVAWAFAQPDIWRFGAFVDLENHASARVMEKAGLIREGVLRRWLVHPNLGPAPRDCASYAVTRVEGR